LKFKKKKLNPLRLQKVSKLLAAVFQVKTGDQQIACRRVRLTASFDSLLGLSLAGRGRRKLFLLSSSLMLR
jgi:hypothetical protein